MSPFESVIHHCQDAIQSLHRTDSIPILINRLLMLMLVCNFFLFLGSFTASMVPDIALDTLLISFLLIFQNIISMIILNNSRMPHSLGSILQPSDFLLGVCLGIAIGGSILAFILSLFFGRMSRCPTASSSGKEEQSTTYYYMTQLCEDHRGTMVGIWFWSGLVFWLDTAIALLIAIGRDELSYFAQNNYETIGISLDEFENSFERYNTQLSNENGGGGGFDQVGDAVVTPTSAASSSISADSGKKKRQDRHDLEA